MEIPQGNSREDNKAWKQIIKDYYASWIANHPDKKVWNKSLKRFIHIKGQSINETAGHASLSYELLGDAPLALEKLQIDYWVSEIQI